MKTSALLASLLAALALSACGGDSGSTNSASATGGNAATSGSVCDEYEKAFAASIANVDAATKEAMQKAFDQSKEALKNLPADQKEAACKVSLDALNGKAQAYLLQPKMLKKPLPKLPKKPKKPLQMLKKPLPKLLKKPKKLLQKLKKPLLNNPRRFVCPGRLKPLFRNRVSDGLFP